MVDEREVLRVLFCERSGALQDRFGANGPSRYTRFSRTFSSQTDRPDQFGISEDDYPINNVSQHFVENKNSGDLKINFDESTPETFEGSEDTSDPCAGLDLNDTTSQNVDMSKNTDHEFGEENVEDERFPLPFLFNNQFVCIENYIAKIHTYLKAFFSHRQVEAEAKEHGLDKTLFAETFRSFKRNIFKEAKVDTDLYNILYELQNEIGHVDDLLPFFLSYAKRLYPVLDCLEDLKEISDFTGPADLFPEARAMKRKFIFHAGPTNSGKTHKALERFQSSKSGIYCGPLRLLASEVYQKTNDNGILCDLITGEERRWAVSENEPSNHLACTVEVCSATREYDCAVIDEIQMIGESERGFAWTKALLGLLSPEIHLCGEPTAIDLIKRLVESCGDEFEVVYHERLTPLEIESASLDSDFSKIERGDCIIAFSQRELYRIRKIVESSSKWKCAIVYGGLPPATKVDQARRFNDPNDNCKVLIASDAVGMGLNLNIRRIVFSSMEKFDGKRMSSLSSSQVKQIAGRAGRYGTEYHSGLVTTYYFTHSLHEEDLTTLRDLMSQGSTSIKEAGIAPTSEQVEMFSYQLPKASLKKILETFCGLSQVSGNYFICSLDKKMVTAELIENIPLAIRDRYTLCMSPADCRLPFTRVMLVRFARAISSGKLISAEGLRRVIGWPPSRPTSLRSMQELEVLHESFDLYLWLSYRYPEIFIDREKIRAMQSQLQTVINNSLSSSIALTGILPQVQSTAAVVVGDRRDDRGQDMREQSRSKRSNSQQRTTEYDQSHDRHWWEKGRKQINTKQSSLTTKLLKDKVLTRRQLDRLQEEWRQNFTKHRKSHNK
ncbi:ATP-dependent RNA helicase SUPV3L1, mitochondrial-like [Dendronephthya gigantea]|uniref:ATP-dependent RNA helicase SUPV3L1, mitochondrial-like n=1 Tax=Dendronephthya gigantea TaxID=151771 RepID=UPI00106AFF46|nr:ATP-dependent RNA helicase SUPV3L1, mitochondrial-like [Dendronephthya gigantea]